MFSEYFDAGYFAEGYWTVVGEPGPDNVTLQLQGTLDGLSGNVTLRLEPVAPPAAGGGGPGRITFDDVERMRHHLRVVPLRIKGTLGGLDGRIELAGRYTATLRATLDSPQGRVELRRKFTAQVIDAEDEDWLLLL